MNINKYLCLFAITLSAYSSCSLAKNICVFCSSKEKIATVFKSDAYYLGKELALNDFGLVTGGRNTGLMTLVIDGHASTNTKSPQYAVIPKSLEKYNVLNTKIPKKNVIWVKDLHDRLDTFYTKCEAIVVLPGGWGTMHELMDSIENYNFGIISKPIYILNLEDFWNPTLQQFNAMIEANAAQKNDLQHFKVVSSVKELIQELKSSN